MINNSNYGCDEVKTILAKIVELQKEAVREELKEQMCDFNELGNCGKKNDINTRPLQVYTINDKPWYCPIDSNEDGCENPDCKITCLFRVEKVEDNIATFRALKEEIKYGHKHYESTDSFITIKLANIAAVRCLKDCFVDLCIR